MFACRHHLPASVQLATLPFKNGDDVKAFWFCFYSCISVILLSCRYWLYCWSCNSVTSYLPQMWTSDHERRVFDITLTKFQLNIGSRRCLGGRDPYFTTIRGMWEYRTCFSNFWGLNHQIPFFSQFVCDKVK